MVCFCPHGHLGAATSLASLQTADGRTCASGQPRSQRETRSGGSVLAQAPAGGSGRRLPDSQSDPQNCCLVPEHTPRHSKPPTFP